jgi:hypothetical protein
MSIDDLVDVSKGIQEWNKVVEGIDFNSPLDDEHTILLRKRIVDSLAYLRRQSTLNAGIAEKDFCLSEAYSDFSFAAHSYMASVGYDDPREILHNLPRRIKTVQEESLEKTVSRVNTAGTMALTLGGAIVGALFGSKLGYDSVITGVSSAAGAVAGCLASKPLLKLALTGFADKIKHTKKDADNAFSKSIDRYIKQNTPQEYHSQPL